jgi:prepilin-type N-terminal cleavage/methylation domain-containing protein
MERDKRLRQRDKNMKIDLSLNKRGITLIELLIAFVILAITVAAIYRIFITQTRAYTIQDQKCDGDHAKRSPHGPISL